MHSCPPFLYKRGVPIEIFFTKKNRLIYSYKQLNHCCFRGTYSATERYMMICDNDWGQSGWSATERDFDDWNIRQYEWNQSLPGVSSVTIDKCESSTNGGGGWKL